MSLSWFWLRNFMGRMLEKYNKYLIALRSLGLSQETRSLMPWFTSCDRNLALSVGLPRHTSSDKTRRLNKSIKRSYWRSGSLSGTSTNFFSSDWLPISYLSYMVALIDSFRNLFYIWSLMKFMVDGSSIDYFNTFWTSTSICLSLLHLLTSSDALSVFFGLILVSVYPNLKTHLMGLSRS